MELERAMFTPFGVFVALAVKGKARRYSIQTSMILRNGSFAVFMRYKKSK
jgi:hypothetical protein